MFVGLKKARGSLGSGGVFQCIGGDEYATTGDAMSGLIVSADIKVEELRTLAVATEEEGIAAVVAVMVAVAMVVVMDGEPHNAFDKTDLIIL
jgi:hypothetical protein